MKSLYDAKQANTFIGKYAEAHGEALALRVYTSRLLGADAALVLHGGGNTSVKATAREMDGTAVEVLYVKGSGWDLAAIEPAGFPACRLAPLQRMAALEHLSDADMVRGLRSQMLDPASPTPSVEALLHAILPARFVDHTHSDAVLTVVNHADGERRARQVWGQDVLFVPYVMPGFALSRALFQLLPQLEQCSLLILDKHGIFTWGETAQESYEAMIRAVTQAEDYVSSHAQRVTVPRAANLSLEARRALQRQLAPVLRGAISEREGNTVIGQWRDSAPILSLLARDDASSLTQRGTLTPDHVIRTKPVPLWWDAPLASTTADLQQQTHRQLDAYARWYDQYFTSNAQRHPGSLRQLPSTPKLIAVPGAGVFAVGDSVKDVQVAGDLYEHTASVIERCSAIGSFEPAALPDLFDVEYWSLEQAKLKLGAAVGRFARKVVLVTGGAGGIGLATVRCFLEQRAHVILADIDAVSLEAAGAELRAFGEAVRLFPVDVATEEGVATLFNAAIDAFGGVDIVVSNAGNAPRGALHSAHGTESLRQSLELNLLSHQHVARRAAELFLAQGVGGCLLFNASKSAFNQGPGFGPYSVAKAALVSLMRQYAVDLGPHGIRSNAVNADRIRTKIFSEELFQERAAARGLSVDSYFQSNLLGRETTARDVAEAFTYLASAHATTGSVVTVDGGNAAAFPR